VITDEEDNTIAHYEVYLVPAVPKEVRLLLRFESNSGKSADRVVYLVLRMVKGRIVTSVATDKCKLPDSVLTENQAFGNTYRSRILKVKNFIVDNESDVRSFLKEEAQTRYLEDEMPLAKTSKELGTEP